MLRKLQVFSGAAESVSYVFEIANVNPPLLPLTSVKGHFLHPCPNDKKVSYELVMGSLTRPSLITGVGTQIAAPTNLLARDPTILTRQQLIWLLFRPGRPHRRAFVRSLWSFYANITTVTVQTSTNLFFKTFTHRKKLQMRKLSKK